MTFEDYVQENNLNCYLDEDAMYAIEKVWNHQQEKIDHIREYLTSGMEVATENSEYWLALRDCLDELDWI